MPKFRTKKSERTTYIYKDAYGNVVCEVKPGENGVTDALIAELHSYDDAVHNATKRDVYHGLQSYDYSGSDEDNLSDAYKTALADNTANPSQIFFEQVDAVGLSESIKVVWNSLTDNQRNLIQKKFRGMTNVEIAAEENVTEAAIRNRLTKLQKKFMNFLK